MPDAAVVLIIEEVKARLGNVTIANGYDLEFVTVTLANPEPLKTEDIPMVNFWGGSDTLLESNYGTEKRQIPITIEGYGRNPDLNIYESAYNMMANIMTGLHRTTAAPGVSDTPDPNLAGLIDHMKVVSREPLFFQNDSPDFGCLLQLSIDYTAEIGDAFNLL